MKKNSTRKNTYYKSRRKATKSNSVSETNELKKVNAEKSETKSKTETKTENEKKNSIEKKTDDKIKFYPFNKVEVQENTDEVIKEESLPIELKQDEVKEDVFTEDINNNSFDEENKETETTFFDEIRKEKSSQSESKPDEVSYTKSKYNFYLSYEQRLILNLVAIVVLFVLSLVIFVSSITVRSTSSMLYNQKSNLSYNVTLKENDYYNEENLNENMQYIASLIDYVDVNFNYNFSSSSTFDYTYTYYIEAYVSVTDGDNSSSIIYSKVDRLTDPVTVANSNSSSFNINQSVRINYDDYNDMVKEFKSTYGLSADSSLVLSLRLEIKDKEGTVIRSTDASDTTSVTIPLTQQLVSISIDTEDVNNSNSVRVYQDFSISNKFAFVLSIIILLSAVASVVKLILFIKKTTKKKSNYDIMLSKILREYDRVIVNVKKEPIITGKIVDVSSFNELLDVRDNIEKPIMFYELHKGQKSIFIVNSDVIAYRYILKSPDLEK